MKNFSEFTITNARCYTDTGFIKSNISIKDGLIFDMGDHSFSEKIDFNGFSIFPGFINSHTHCAMTFLRDLAHNVGAPIENLFFKTESQLTKELVELFSYGYLINSIKTGTTSVIDHYYFSEGVANACESLGVRGFIGECLQDIGGAFPSVETLSMVKKSIKNWRFSDLIKPIICPHATDTVSLKFAKKIGDFSRSEGLPLHFHLSQTMDEYKKAKNNHSLSPIQLADKFGWLSRKALAVHVLYADDNDLKILKEKDVFIGNCPKSQIIYEKLAPIDRFYKEELKVCLGTDCASSNDQANMIEEKRFLYLLLKNKGINQKELFEFVHDSAWKNPALLLNEKIGQIKKGYKADFFFVKKTIESLPLHKNHVNSLFSLESHHIKHSMIDGKWAMVDSVIAGVNESDLTERFEEAMKKIKISL